MDDTITFGIAMLSTLRCRKPSWTRFLSTAHLPFSKFSHLRDVAPVFALRGQDIHPLVEPTAFYTHLKSLIAITELYVPDSTVGSKKTDIYCRVVCWTNGTRFGMTHFQQNVSTLRLAMRHTHALQVHVLVDCLRGTRMVKGQSSATLLLPLLQEFPGRIQVSLYHTPDLKGWLKRVLPQRFNESIGLMHIKVFGFDDNVLLSGANLNHDYFTNRQDRYIAFENAPALSDYFADLVHTVGSFSYQLSPSASRHSHPYDLITGDNTPDPVYQSDLFKQEASRRMRAFIDKWMSSSSVLRHESASKLHDEYDTLVLPVIQMGPFGIRQDEAATMKILDIADVHGNREVIHAEEKFWTIVLTSGYFNFTNHYKSRVLKTSSRFQLLTASPEANGFFNSQGVSKYLPPAYTYIEHQFFTEVVRQEKDHIINIQEYKRPGWTYHAKGLWIYFEGEQWPFLTMIGSPNFGYRSSERDLEGQAIIITKDEPLRKAIHHELDCLKRHSVNVTAKTFNQDDRKVPYLVRLAASIIKSMLKRDI
ncbi:hypothetical protein BC936DRAFT_145950 [Jimgerdemannia flammicorona]|uniref:CDP-diacylglycerol--glycerol-3-phosphate 3-phosphatidyltransferase n=1 Tax=Jimgerdemannia flammicorona TaxID=994334 RepID=A0A433DLS6_9FUNG|nr:hypothetical protein BC936DRAFT_145950 [Jimgerdemannia flammicorona]